MRQFVGYLFLAFSVAQALSYVVGLAVLLFGKPLTQEEEERLIYRS